MGLWSRKTFEYCKAFLVGVWQTTMLRGIQTLGRGLAYEASEGKDSVRNQAGGHLCNTLAKNLTEFFPSPEHMIILNLKVMD